MVVIEVAVKNKGTKAFRELLLLSFSSQKVRVLHVRLSSSLLALKLIFLKEKNCLLTEGEVFHSAAR